MEAKGIVVARTDLEGTIVVRAEADGSWERVRP
jgi:hypothetical protein